MGEFDIITETGVRPRSNIAAMSTAERIRRARAAANMSQADVARALGVSRGAIAQWETGRTGPDRSRVRHLAALLRVSANYLLGISDDPVSLQDEEPPVPRSPAGDGETLPVYDAHPIYAPGYFSLSTVVTARLQRPQGISENSQAFGFRLPVSTPFVRYKKGELVVISDQEVIHTGDDVIVETKAGEKAHCLLMNFVGVRKNCLLFFGFPGNEPNELVYEYELGMISRFWRIYRLDELLSPKPAGAAEQTNVQTNAMMPKGA